MTRNVLTWLEQSALRTPDAIAFENETQGITFSELLLKAKQIGTFLARSVPPQSPVAILMEKGPSCVAAMLGVVYAGCFYTPVDTASPAQRVELIYSVLKPAFVLTAIEETDGAIDEDLLRRVRSSAIDTDLVYVLFTSGSTGVPKGVSISHRAVADFVQWACDALAIDASCRFGNQAPLYFDNSVLDIYCALYAGACVHFIPNKFFLFPVKLMDYLLARSINTIFWVPSVLVSVANAGALRDVGLRRVYFCGEVMPVKQLNMWRKAMPGARYVNMYGPTEITDVCTWFEVSREFADDQPLPIGHACQNSRVFVWEGEICVAGTCLSSGYYNAPEKTREVFVQNPLRPEIMETVYKTGDLGEYNDLGELMFLGRKDSQIKRHGYRIELGEVESAVMTVERVAEACCLYDAERESIVCAYAGDANEKEIKVVLKAKLPKYMLPDRYIHMPQLPKTGNGKIDRMHIKREHP